MSLSYPRTHTKYSDMAGKPCMASKRRLWWACTDIEHNCLQSIGCIPCSWCYHSLCCTTRLGRWRIATLLFDSHTCLPRKWCTRCCPAHQCRWRTSPLDSHNKTRRRSGCCTCRGRKRCTPSGCSVFGRNPRDMSHKKKSRGLGSTKGSTRMETSRQAAKNILRYTRRTARPRSA